MTQEESPQCTSKMHTVIDECAAEGPSHGTSIYTSLLKVLVLAHLLRRGGTGGVLCKAFTRLRSTIRYALLVITLAVIQRM
jgi:hypothetical protein